MELQHGEARVAVGFERGDECVDLFFRRLGAEADTQHARGGLFVKAHRAVDVAQLPAMTGGACRDADALCAKFRNDIRRRVADERDRQDVRRGPVADADDAVEIPVVDELSDTGELYDVEEFNRLLAEDAALAEEAGETDDAEEPGDPEPADELEAIDDSEPVDDTGEEESATERS